MTQTAWGFVASMILLGAFATMIGPAALGWTALFIPVGVFAAWRALR